ncbi:MAG: hypothetical protein DRI65_17820, partial [Chloroflexota bacterium]
QSIWHRVDNYTRKEAAAWCTDHDFKTDDYRTALDNDGKTVTHHIHAQFDPGEGVDDTWAFLSDDFPEGVLASVCQRKEKSMELKYTKGVQSADDPMEFIMSDQSVDRMGDIIVAKGWQLEEFKENPIALAFHRHDKPIGLWEKVRVEGKKLIGRLKLAKAGTSAEIDTLRSLLEQRIIKAVSVGFAPIEYEYIRDVENDTITGIKFLKQALHETSLVAVPANANALAVAKSFGLDQGQLDHFFAKSKYTGQIAAPLATIERVLGTAARPDARN